MSGFEDRIEVDADIKYKPSAWCQRQHRGIPREHAEFMDNALKYQASLNLLDSRIKGLRAAIKGE